MANDYDDNEYLNSVNSGYFHGQTISQMDEELDKVSRRHDMIVKCFFIICAVALFIVFKGPLSNLTKFNVATQSGYDSAPISAKDNPVQKNYNASERAEKEFNYKSLVNDTSVRIVPQAHYVLSGRILESQSKYIYVTDMFESAALYEFVAVWGELADHAAKGGIKKAEEGKFSNQDLNEATGSTKLRWIWSNDKGFCPLWRRKISHNYAIPATKNVMAALLKIKPNDVVVIEGDLVDVYSFDGTKKYLTSMSRKDDLNNTKGSFPSEIIYVTKVKLGNVVYK